MDTKHDRIRLTSVEIGSLWNSYMLHTMVHHVISYFLQHVDDQDIKAYLEHCQIKSKENTEDCISIFNEDKFPIPHGTTSGDINLQAPRLFSDVFYINYIKNMARYALTQFAIFYSEGSREDIREMFSKHLHILEGIDKMGTEIMLSKGIYLRPPHIPELQGVSFVKQKTLFNGFFNSKRPLSVLEITQLFHLSKSNALGKAMLMGFSQVAKSEEVRQNLLNGKELSHKLYKLYSDVLEADDITIAPSFDSEVFASTEAPFSDRLMMNHVTALIAYGIGAKGIAISQSQRSDLVGMYTRAMAEISTYGKDCMNLLIKNEWMEEPPLAPNRAELSHA